MKTVVLAVVWMMAGVVRACAQSGAVASGGAVEVLHAPAGSVAGGGLVGSAGGVSVVMSTGGMHAGGWGAETPGGSVLLPDLTGQLYDVRSLAVSSAPAEVEEGGVRQMAAVAVMDDASILHVDPGRVTWCESSDALAGIDSGGRAFAAAVYQDEVAVVRAIYQLVCDAVGFELTVVNTNADDYGAYAADGLDDDWQVAWFGPPPNAEAGPGEDPDGDGQDNRFEFLSGFSPLAAMERFELRVVAVDRVAGTADLCVNRMIPGRIYHLLACPDLDGGFEVIAGLPPVSEPEEDRVFRDTGAAAGRMFYIIGISKP